MMNSSDSTCIGDAVVAVRIVARTGSAGGELRKTVWPGNIAPAFKLKIIISEE